MQMPETLSLLGSSLGVQGMGNMLEPLFYRRGITWPAPLKPSRLPVGEQNG